MVFFHEGKEIVSVPEKENSTEAIYFICYLFFMAIC